MSNIRRGVHCTSANGHRAQQSKSIAKQIAKNQNAITLIALVITIIVLLILAGVALSLVVGEDGITARAVKSRDVHNIAGIQEKANLAYHDSLIGGYVEDGVYHEVTLGDILSTLKTDGDIEDFGTTNSSSITGISLGMDSLDLAVGGSQTLTVSSTADDAGDYYVQYEGQKYLAHLENGNIVIDKDPMGDGGSSFEISNVSSSNAAVTAEKVGTNQVTVTGSSRGSSTVTVSYGSITATLNVSVKQNVTVLVSSEDTTKGTVTALAQSSYLEGTKIALTATPATNYALEGWYIGTTKQILDSEGKYTVPTDGTTSVALVAKFAGVLDEETSGVGYYIKKGDEYAIIFADRVAQSGTTVTWSDEYSCSCTFPELTDTENFKTYVISDETYWDFGFGTKNILEVSSDSTGTEDRFMALSLRNIITDSGGDFVWYGSALVSDYVSTGGSDGKGSPTSKGFLMGEKNTETMIAKWNNEEYGTQDSNSRYKDVWGQIQTQAGNGWFVPSFEEWSAFGWAMKEGKLKSGETSYTKLGLAQDYWTSSLSSSSTAWNVAFDYDLVNKFYGTMSNAHRIRLATTY